MLVMWYYTNDIGESTYSIYNLYIYIKCIAKNTYLFGANYFNIKNYLKQVYTVSREKICLFKSIENPFLYEHMMFDQILSYFLTS